MIKLNNITKLYNQKAAIKDASFVIEKNKINCFIGRNGAGKTTLIKILLQQIEQTSGTIEFSEDISKYDISYLAEERGLYLKNSVEENIRYFCDLAGSKNIDQRIDEVLKEFDIEQYKQTRIDKLSKGNAQKVQLACVFAPQSKVIILDEPFSGLDYINAIKLAATIKKYAEDRYIIISTHQMKFVDDFADNVLVVNDGNVLFSGDVITLKNNSPLYLIVEKTKQNLQLITEKQLSYKTHEQKYLISNLTKKQVLELINLNFETFAFDYLKTSDIVIELLGGNHE